MDAALYARFFEVEDWYWWSVGTREMFRDWLVAAVAVPGATLLDVGCGTGAFAADLGSLGRVTAIDLSPDAVAFTRRRGVERLCVASAEALPFAPARFDVVTAVDVIEHADDQRALGEIARVVKPGGAVLIHVPAFPFLWGEHDEVNHHRRRYWRGELERLVEAQGLRIERMSYVNFVLFPVVLVVRLGKRLLGRLVGARPPRPEIYDLPAWVNRLLLRLMRVERRLMRHMELPVGVGLLCLARKAEGGRPAPAVP
jgi:SAM-dependent methyltransferase